MNEPDERRNDLDGLEVETLHEKKRGCGFRAAGGLYLMQGEFTLEPCGRLPMPLTVCPTCNGGIKPARGWTWVKAADLLAGHDCEPANACRGHCPLHELPDRAGLLWIGEKFYATPAEYMREAQAQGISRRLSAIPTDIEVGTTVVLLAHRKAIPAAIDSEDPTPAVFSAFRPTHIEYVVKEDDDPEKLKRLVKRGVKLVRVVPVDDDGNTITPDDGPDDSREQNGFDFENGR